MRLILDILILFSPLGLIFVFYPSILSVLIIISLTLLPIGGALLLSSIESIGSDHKSG